MRWCWSVFDLVLSQQKSPLVLLVDYVGNCKAPLMCTCRVLNNPWMLIPTSSGPST
jgi:hypothetical protein